MDEHEYYCTHDADGRCPECIGRMMDQTESLIRIFKKFQEDIIDVIDKGDTVCKKCRQAYKDHTTARIIRETLGNIPAKMRPGAVAILLAEMKKKGIPMPLSEKAAEDVMREGP